MNSSNLKFIILQLNSSKQSLIALLLKVVDVYISFLDFKVPIHIKLKYIGNKLKYFFLCFSG